MQSRAWLWTYNDYPEIVVGEMPPWHKDGDYTLYGPEVAPTTGTPHLQGFTYFAKKKSIGGIRKWFTDQWDAIHIGDKDGKPSRFIAKSIDYCKGLTLDKGMVINADLVEFGKPPKQDGNDGTDYESACRAAEESRFDEIAPVLRVKHFSSFIQMEKRAKMTSIPHPVKLDERLGSGLWYWGAPSTGKSTAARDFDDVYVAPVSKSAEVWFPGYKGESIIVIDDLGPSDAAKYGDWLKQAVDIWPYRFRTGTTTWVCARPKHVIVTSNFHPNMLFPNRQILDPLLLRFKITEFRRGTHGA